MKHEGKGLGWWTGGRVVGDVVMRVGDRESEMSVMSWRECCKRVMCLAIRLFILDNGKRERNIKSCFAVRCWRIKK